MSDVWPFLAIADHIISALSAGQEHQLTALISIPNQRNVANTAVQTLNLFGNSGALAREARLRSTMGK